MKIIKFKSLSVSGKNRVDKLKTMALLFSFLITILCGNKIFAQKFYVNQKQLFEHQVENVPKLNAQVAALYNSSNNLQVNSSNKIIQQIPKMRQISGIVKGEDGRPLIGVGVMVKGTTIGTITDANGKFSLEIPIDAKTLVFSYVGMKTVELPIDGNTVFNVVMEETAIALEEVVAIGYGTARTRDLTGSISSLKTEELQKSKGVSFMDALQGRVAGVRVTSSSGEPGAGLDISIRGANSINAGTQPLYIIDDVQIDVNPNEIATHSYTSSSVQYNPLASINPSDILSIEVLKDASATAIFGSRGANGVIIVTTKQGRKGKTTVDFDAGFGVSSATKTLKVLQGQDFANYRFAKSPYDTWGVDTDENGIPDTPRDVSDLESHNWQDEVLRSAISQNYNIGIMGGTDKTRFNANFGYLNQEGIVIKNGYERYTARVKADTDLNSKLTLGANINFSNAITNGAVTTSGNQAYNGLIQYFILYRPVILPEQPDEMGNPENGGMTNPITFLNDAYKSIPSTRTMIDGYFRYKLTNNLSLRVSAASTMTHSKGEEWYPRTTSWGYEQNGNAYVSETNTNSWQSSNTLNYVNSFGKGRHYVNAMIGFELSEYTYNNWNTRAQGFVDQSYMGVFDLSQASVFPDKVRSYKESNSRESEFGRINYNLLERYLFTASLRRDGSSKFGKNNKYAYFPSGAFAWKMEKEKFMQKQKLFSELKLRASYGVTGNDRIENYRALARTEKTYYVGYTKNAVELGLSPAEISNPDLKWETTYQLNLGTDIQMFKDRLGIVFDWYNKKTKDMLLRVGVPSQIGSYRQWQNIGQVDNNGIELLINTVNIKTKNFTWSTSLNFNMNKNKVKSLGNLSFISVHASGGHFSEVARVIVGQPIGTGWGYVYDGVYQTDDFNPDGTLKEGVARPSTSLPKPGDMKFKDLSGDTIVDPVNDKTVISHSDPDHFGGLTNTFNYKNFDFSFLLQWSYGNDILNLGRYRYEAFNGYSNVTYEYWNNKWSLENPTNKYPGLNGEGKTESSSYYVEDGSYLS